MNEWSNSQHAAAYLARLEDIPHRKEGESTLLSEIPATTRRVLDLGCGNGHLLSLVLTQFPDANGIALDFSELMLKHAKQRFLDDPRVQVVDHNMDDALPDLGVFDCIVSSFAIHHCADERKQTLYGEVYSHLMPGGVFCNLEHVASPNERIHARFMNTLGLSAEDEDPSNQLVDVETQLRWLRKIGFEDVDCHWKWRELALLCGQRPIEKG